MENNEVTNVLKSAIILEHRGKALYEQVARQTNNEGVREIFQLMADEEQMHIDFLSRQFESYRKEGTFSPNDFSEVNVEEESFSRQVLDKKITEEISGAGFEAAAISAAIDMENKSVEVYSERAKHADDPHEKELYQWLADWEKGHHKLLIDLNKQLTEKIWYDNKFWPF